jgi:hypothetical protein
MMMLSSWLSVSSALLLLNVVEGGKVQFNPVETLFGNGFVPKRNVNATRFEKDPFAPTPEERAAEREARRLRQRERNTRMKEAMKYIRPDKVEKVSQEDLEALSEDHPSLRELGWGYNKQDNSVQFADPGDDYDMYQQAYRMLGGFIDCDHDQDGDGSGDNDSGDDSDGACSRWMLWASVSTPFRTRLVRWFHFGICKLLTHLILCYSTSTPTTRAMDMMNILEMNPSVFWIATTPTLNGSF